jgi:TfoX/Sxy family transcriptional regulator of competence genes
MVYDPRLAQRVTTLMARQAGFDEKKMFGGICYLVNGNMACGVLKADLIVRVGAENQTECLQRPHTRPFDITGRPMKGWVMVSADGCRSDADLAAWIERGVAMARSLPAKKKK